MPLRLSRLIGISIRLKGYRYPGASLSSRLLSTQHSAEAALQKPQLLMQCHQQVRLFHPLLRGVSGGVGQRAPKPPSLWTPRVIQIYMS